VSGRVRVNRDKNESNSRSVRPGDVLTIAAEAGVRVLKVVSPGLRRGPPTEARLLYEDLSPPAPTVPLAERDRGAGRPTKRDRRALNDFRRDPGDDFSRNED
jgi:ribosome-associated heat shock protein Hsp15